MKYHSTLIITALATALTGACSEASPDNKVKAMGQTVMIAHGTDGDNIEPASFTQKQLEAAEKIRDRTVKAGGGQ